MDKLTHESPEVAAFLKAWEVPYGRKSRAVTRSKYIAIDFDNGPESWSGCYLIDRETRTVYTIKAYGVRKNVVGQLEDMTRDFEAKANAKTKQHGISVKAVPAAKGKITLQQIVSACQSGDYVGFCIACGFEQEGVEPDARKYECESCGENKVYGAQELLIMNVA